MTDAPANPQAGDQPTAPSIRVMGQYVKDLSFENPSAPDSLRQGSQPNINLGVDVRARGLDAETYEVELVISANAQGDQKALFIAELTYAGLFQIRNLDERARDAFLLIECPRIIFPFARRVLADATRDGGFPPLMLEPIDFAALYRQKAAQQQGDQPSDAGTNGGGPSGAA
jgi:preprotein translocase subunit SecB